jgi:hypothetical protein
MAEYSTVTFAERDLDDAWAVVQEDAWPEFMQHDAIWGEHSHLLDEAVPDWQFVLFDERGDPVVGGNCIPFEWDHDPAHLPDGIDGVLQNAAAMFAAGRTPTAASALQIVVRRDRLGHGLSRRAIETMAGIVAQHGVRDLVAPVRPTQKHRYPLIELDRYAHWRRADGSLFDPWLRAHERAGATPVGVCPHSMTITGTVDEWEEWAGMAFPETGLYVVPDALVPVAIDRERNLGTYVEPNYWMHHRCD